MIDLDDVRSLAGHDPGGMLGQVAGLPDQLARAAAARAAFRTAHPDLASAQPAAPHSASSVLVCGMGGSAIGAEFAGVWAAQHGVRVGVHRSYGLPAWIDAHTWLVFSSYSGNTEETLAAFDASARLGAPRLCVTTGGALAERARRAGVPRFELPGGLQPRAALGHSLVALLLLLHDAGMVPADPLPDIEAAARQLVRLRDRCSPDRARELNPAKRLALRLHGHLPFIYTGPGLTQPVGVRWKGQLHENAKTLAATSVFPELDHNEIMAWQALPEVRRAALLVLLRDRDDGAAIARRMRITAEILSPRVAGLEWIDTEGETALERMLGAASLADWTSVYLAFLNGVDPTPVNEIEQLKKRLAAEAESA